MGANLFFHMHGCDKTIESNANVLSSFPVEDVAETKSA